MEYARIYWGAVAGLGGLLCVRHGPALFGSASMAGNLPPVFGVLAGIGVFLAGARGLYLRVERPQGPTAMFGLVVVLFLLQGLAVIAWLAGAAWG